MSSDLALLDTNILVEAVYVDAEYHWAARALLDQAKQNEATFCLVPQVLIEFYAVVTNPRRVTEAKSSEEALDAITSFLALPGITLLPVPVDIVTRWTDRVRRHGVTGHKVFDVQLVAAMQGNGVTKIYTFNVQDFTPFADLVVIEPTPS